MFVRFPFLLITSATTHKNLKGFYNNTNQQKIFLQVTLD